MSTTDAAPRGQVTVRNLTKSFRLNRRSLTVLKGLTLEIGPGECHVIVGASGSGKTTLLRVLDGLDANDSGVVLIDGRPVNGVGNEHAGPG